MAADDATTVSSGMARAGTPQGSGVSDRRGIGSRPGVTDRAALRAQYGDGSTLDARASIYSWQRPRIDLVAEVLDRVDVEPGTGLVVDVGCGRGQYLSALAARGHHALGIDLSPGLAHATRRVAGVATAVGDATALPLPDASAAATLALHVLYHLPDPADGLRELRRITRPGGTIVVLTNGAAHLAEYRDLLAQAAGRPDGLTSGAAGFTLEHRSEAESILGPVDLVAFDGTIELDHVEPLVRYAESARTFYEPQTVRPWAEVVERFRRLCAEQLATHGHLRLTTRSGLFVARR